MNDSRHNRAWYHLGSLTWIVALAMFGALLVANLDSRIDVPPAPEAPSWKARSWEEQYVAQFWTIRFNGQSAGSQRHGWPLTFLERPQQYAQPSVSNSIATTLSDDGGNSAALAAWLTSPNGPTWQGSDPQAVVVDGWVSVPQPASMYAASHWPFDAAPVTQFSAAPLAGNIAFALAILLGSVLVVERFRRRTGVSGRFTLRAILALTGWVATIFWLFGAEYSRWLPALGEAALNVVLLAGVGLAWLAAIDLLGKLPGAVSWMIRRRPQAEDPTGAAKK